MKHSDSSYVHQLSYGMNNYYSYVSIIKIHKT